MSSLDDRYIFIEINRSPDYTALPKVIFQAKSSLSSPMLEKLSVYSEQSTQ